MGLPYFYQIHFWFADHYYYMAKYFVKQLDRKFYLFSIIILKDIFNVYKKVYHHDYIKGKENPSNFQEKTLASNLTLKNGTQLKAIFPTCQLLCLLSFKRSEQTCWSLLSKLAFLNYLYTCTLMTLRSLAARLKTARLLRELVEALQLLLLYSTQHNLKF